MTEGSKFSRLRKPVGRLRDLPIWSKLGLIMIVPTIATIIVGTAGLVANISAANDADRTRTLARLSQEAGTVIQELQNERAAGVMFVGSRQDTRGPTQESYDKQIPQTDNAVSQYRQSRRAVGDLSGEAQDNLDEADRTLGDLSRLRDQVKTVTELEQSIVAFRYRVIIADLTQVRETAIRLTTDPKLSTSQQAAAAVSDHKAAINEERIVILRVLTNQTNNNSGMTLALRRAYENALATQDAAVARFAATSTQDERDLLDQTLTGSDVRKAFGFRGAIDSNGASNGEKLIFTAPAWDSAISTEANLLRQVELTLDERVVLSATDVRDDLRQTVLVQTGLLLSMLLLAILFAWLVARSMARSLRELRHGALTVAQYGLPQAVARLREPSLAIGSSPEHIAKQIAEPLPVRSRDEFGQVTEAFNAVHLEAVRTAAEQAQLRASVATMFVNLARRSQILVDRLIGHLDRLERGEEDPDRLAELFQLDHLATRMRRNDENLLVLAGADSSRVQREPAPLMDVLRAAQSEVEHYTRIEFGMIDRDVEIAAHSVNDMVHLIAELLDNATAFSPPDSAVVVEARRVGERCVLLVEDRGIGISPDQLRELNEKLGNPPAVDVAVSRMMGLVVVARLAARHGVRVELRAARERGTVADITLPTGVLVQRLTAGRNTGELPVVGAGSERSLQGPPSRPAMGMPSTLAIEGGGRPPRERTPSAFASGPAFSPTNPTTPTRTPGTPSSPGRGSGTPGIPGAQPPAGTFGHSPSAFDQGQPPSSPAFGRPASGGMGGPGGPGGPGNPGNPSGPGRPGAPAGGRGLPPWSDLTGASSAGNGNGSHGPGRQDPGAPGLPLRRLGDDDPSDGNGSIPRQRPADAPQQPSGAQAPGVQSSGAQSAGLPARPTSPGGGSPASGPGGLPTRPTTPSAPAIPASGAPSGPGGLPTRPTTPDGGPTTAGPAGLPTRPATPSAPAIPTSGAPSSGSGGLPPRPVSGRPGQPGQPGQSGAGQPAQPAAAQPAPPAWPPASSSPGSQGPGSQGPGSRTSGSQAPGAPVSGASAPGTPVSGAPTSSASGPTRPASAPSESGYSPALDMTAEIPRVRDDWAPPAAPAANGQLGTAGDDLTALPRPDQTMELPPIFRDVESAWFRTRRPSPMRALTNGSNGAAPAAPDTASGAPASGPSAPARPVSSPPVSGAPASGPATGPSSPLPPRRPATGPSAMPTGAPWSPPPASQPASQPASGAPSSSPLPPRTPSSPLPPRTPAPAMASNAPPAGPTSAPTDRLTPGESVTWRTAADDGWRAAEALGQDRDFNLTEGGLPKRVPMSQLVPGGVERATTAQHKRTPEAVRGLLSAYHRGVQRGRSQQSPSSTDSRTPQPTQAGPSNPQGKEREA
jgi:signal transduction histidine kinase